MRITHARNTGYHHVDTASSSRALVPVDEILAPREILRRMMSRIEADTARVTDPATGELEPEWIGAFALDNKTAAREAYYRLAREFGVWNWERLPWQARVIVISLAWSGTHPPVDLDECEYVSPTPFGETFVGTCWNSCRTCIGEVTLNGETLKGGENHIRLPARL